MNHDDNKLTAQQESQHEPQQDAVVSENESGTENSNQYSAENKTASNTDESANTNTETHTETEKTWHNKNAMKRGIAMLGYGFIAGFVRLGITLIAVFQFFSLLFSEKPNQPLVRFGQNLNTYQYQINQFLTVNSEMYPFPFADWPDSSPEEFNNNKYESKTYAPE